MSPLSDWQTAPRRAVRKGGMHQDNPYCHISHGLEVKRGWQNRLYLKRQLCNASSQLENGTS